MENTYVKTRPCKKGYTGEGGDWSMGLNEPHPPHVETA